MLPLVCQSISVGLCACASWRAVALRMCCLAGTRKPWRPLHKLQPRSLTMPKPWLTSQERANSWNVRGARRAASVCVDDAAAQAHG